MIRFISFLLLLGLTSFSAAAQEWVHYVNERFGTSLDYPGDLFVLDRGPDNGDGQSFSPVSGETITLTVWAGFNINELDVEGIEKETFSSDEQPTYRRKGKTWVVSSGFKGHDIFYRKAVLSPDGQIIHYLELTYPSRDKSRYDGLVARISRSFSSGD